MSKDIQNLKRCIGKVEESIVKLNNCIHDDQIQLRGEHKELKQYKERLKELEKDKVITYGPMGRMNTPDPIIPDEL